MTYVKTCLSNVLSGSCPVTRSSSPFAEKVDLEPFCLPKSGFEYIESSNNQKQRVVKGQIMEFGEVKVIP